MNNSILEKVKMLRTLAVDITNCEYYGEDDAVLGNLVPADIVNALDDLTESLRDELAEIEKQDPIYMWQMEGDEGWIECTKEWFEGDISSGYEKRIVYASPVQQSPVSEPQITIEGYDEKALQRNAVESLLRQSPSVAVPSISEDKIKSAYWDFDARVKGIPPYSVPYGQPEHAFLVSVMAMLSTPTPSAEQAIKDAIQYGTGFLVAGANGIRRVNREDVFVEHADDAEGAK